MCYLIVITENKVDIIRLTVRVRRQVILNFEKRPESLYDYISSQLILMISLACYFCK